MSPRFPARLALPAQGIAHAASTLSVTQASNERIAAELNLKCRIPRQDARDPEQARVRQQIVAERAAWLRHVRARRGFEG